MTKKKLIIEVAEDLRSLADKVEKLAGVIDDAVTDGNLEYCEKLPTECVKEAIVEGKQNSGKKLTNDDITKLIVAKIKKDRNSQESIGKLLAGYGVDHISKIPEEKYEAFIKDLSEI